MWLVLMFDSFFIKYLLEDIFPFEHVDFSSKKFLLRKAVPIRGRKVLASSLNFLGFDSI